MNLSPREIATLAAALVFWREEMAPHGRRIMEPYFRRIGVTATMPLNRPELERLAIRLRREIEAQA